MQDLRDKGISGTVGGGGKKEEITGGHPGGGGRGQGDAVSGGY